jgi:hypothetical protein
LNQILLESTLLNVENATKKVCQKEALVEMEEEILVVIEIEEGINFSDIEQNPRTNYEGFVIII